MNGKSSSLQDELEAVFQRACADNDMQVAEYLLEALETLACRNHDDDLLNRVYRQVAGEMTEAQQH